MERGTPHDDNNEHGSSAMKSYRRWRSLESTKTETKLAIKDLTMKPCLSLAEKEELLTLRRLQDQGLEPIRPLGKLRSWQRI